MIKNLAIVFLSALTLVLSLIIILDNGKENTSDGVRAQIEWTTSLSNGSLFADKLKAAGNIVVTPQYFVSLGEDDAGVICRVIYRNVIATCKLDEENIADYVEDVSRELTDEIDTLFGDVMYYTTKEEFLQSYREGEVGEYIWDEIEKFAEVYNRDNITSDDDRKIDEILSVEIIANEALQKQLEIK